MKFADVKKAQANKQWLMQDLRGSGSPLGGTSGNGTRHGGNTRGYWQAHAPPNPGGRDIYVGANRGRDPYPGPYPYGVSCAVVVAVGGRGGEEGSYP